MLAPVSEIYASVQGEGPFAGERQIFLRMAGCPLRCRYCDTPASLVARGHPRYSVDEIIAKIIKTRGNKKIKTVSATGGEPLVYASLLKDVFYRLKKRGFRIYLETAGVHPDALRKVVSLVDVIAMDMKLPSATGQIFWKEHKDFLRIGGRKIFVKVVLEKKSKLQEIAKALSVMKSMNPEPLLVLQPVTPVGPGVEAPSAEHIANAFALASSKLKKVLVMPQQHKIWSVR